MFHHTRNTSDENKSREELIRELAELRENESRYCAVLDNMSEGVMIFDEQGITYQNEASSRIHGQALLIKHKDLPITWKLRDETGRPLLFEEWPISRVLRHESFQDQVVCAVEMETGREFWAGCNGFPLIGADGKLMLGYITVRDITRWKQAEASLTASHRQIQSIIDNTTSIIYAFDLEERFLLANNVVAELFNTTPEKMIGKRRHEFMPREDADWHEENDRQVIETGRALEFEEYSQLKDRSITWLTTKFPLRDVLGRIYAVGGISTDVTEKKLAQDALRQSEERFRSLFVNSMDAIFLTALDGRVYDANPAACKMFQRTKQEFLELGKEAITAADPQKLKECLNTRAQDGSVLCDLTCLRKDGTRFETEVSSFIFRNSKGEDRSFVIVRDITSRKRTEDALLQSQRRLSSIIEQLPDGVGLFDHTGKFIMSNSVMRNLTPGLMPSKDPERVHKWASYDQDGNPVATDLWPGPRALRGEYVMPGMEFVYTRENGQKQWVLISAVPFSAPEGETAAAIVVMKDITERKMSENRIRQMNDILEQRISERTAEAEQRTEALRRLALELSGAEDAERQRLAMILHDDLQQYLAAIRFRLDSLVPDAQADPETAERISVVESLIDESIQKCRNLSHELSPPVLHQSGLIAALGWLAQDMDDKHGLQVSLHAEPDAEPASRKLAAMLFRSIRELLFNIVKHADTDRAQIHMNAQDDRIHIQVSDSGKGFDAHQIGGRQLHKCGFGLFNVEERIHVLGGSFHIKSVPGKGTRIDIRVPNQPLQHEKPDKLKQVFMEGGKEDRHASVEHNGKIRILLADDHVVMRDGLAGILRNQPDMDVVAQAQNGIEAVEMADNTVPDVILMDITMPEMDGIAATEEISKKYPHIRIIGLSMHDDPSIEERMRGAGACAYVYKAAPSNELLQTIRMSVDR
jgi:PAS domain S-box-containing protein